MQERDRLGDDLVPDHAPERPPPHPWTTLAQLLVVAVLLLGVLDGVGLLLYDQLRGGRLTAVGFCASAILERLGFRVAGDIAGREDRDPGRPGLAGGAGCHAQRRRHRGHGERGREPSSNPRGALRGHRRKVSFEATPEPRPFG